MVNKSQRQRCGGRGQKGWGPIHFNWGSLCCRKSVGVPAKIILTYSYSYLSVSQFTDLLKLYLIYSIFYVLFYCHSDWSQFLCWEVRMRENEDVEFGGVDIIGEFVDAENKEIARRHADLQRKNQVLQQLADFSLLLPRSSPAAAHSSSTTSTPPWTRPNSVATFGRRQTVVELTQPNCSSPLGPTQTDWCLYHPWISALCSEKDRLDVHLDLPGGGILQRPHRGGCRPGRPPLHQCQRHRLRGLDGSYVGCMVGWATFDFIFFIFLGMVTWRWLRYFWGLQKLKWTNLTRGVSYD